MRALALEGGRAARQMNDVRFALLLLLLLLLPKLLGYCDARNSSHPTKQIGPQIITLAGEWPRHFGQPAGCSVAQEQRSVVTRLRPQLAATRSRTRTLTADFLMMLRAAAAAR